MCGNTTAPCSRSTSRGGVCRNVAMLAAERGKSVASGNTIGTVLSLARADRRLAAETEQWDREAFLLEHAWRDGMTSAPAICGRMTVRTT